LCADDFGIAPGVSKAILDLCNNHRISATSCMVHGVSWRNYAENLRNFLGSIDIGLHLTLTDQLTPISLPILAPSGQLPSFRHLLTRAFLRNLPLDEIRNLVNVQILEFKKTMGCMPDFVDGHHHVHQLPGVREILIEILLEVPKSERPYLRSTLENWPVTMSRGIAVGKVGGLNILGSKFRQLTDQSQLQRNRGFAGVYDLNDRTPYAELFPKFLKHLVSQSIVMCHPGMVDEVLENCDSFTTRREDEYKYFQSNAFEQHLIEAGAEVGQFSLLS
jgi:predicted glycoside hydrolase/deacetylase ChbG (UPF0249 family)